MRKIKLLAAVFAVAATSAIAPATFAAVSLYVDVAPPASRYEVIPDARPGYIWAPGYWDWRGGRYVWVRGHYLREARGMHWHPHRWVEREGRWALEQGRWAREPFDDRYAYRGWERRHRDSDGDGVPDRYDRAPGNPYRQ